MRVPFAAEATPFILPPAVLGLILLIPGGAWRWAGVACLLLASLALLFFRDPERNLPEGEDILTSPADGRVVRAGPLGPGDDAPGGSDSILAIFLSITDVHINRAPSSGTIIDVLYRPGRFHAAFRAEASSENERNEVRLSTERGPVSFRQIAGVVARRIVFRMKQGDTVKRGQRVGLIRFGSRTELFVDDQWELTVGVGERVRGGETIVARLKRP